MDKNELIIAALKERIAQIVSSYETQMAEFRADATMRMDQFQRQATELQQNMADLVRRAEHAEAELDRVSAPVKQKRVIKGEVVEDPLKGRDGPG